MCPFHKAIHTSPTLHAQKQPPAYGKGFVYFRVLSVDSEGPSVDGATAGK